MCPASCPGVPGGCRVQAVYRCHSGFGSQSGAFVLRFVISDAFAFTLHPQTSPPAPCEVEILFLMKLQLIWEGVAQHAAERGPQL